MVTILSAAVYLRLLGSESYGLVGVYLHLFAVVSLLDLGLPSVITREIAKNRAHHVYTEATIVRSVESIIWLIALCMLVLMLTTLPVFGLNWFNYSTISPDSVQYSLIMMSFVIAIRVPYSLYFAALIGMEKHVSANLYLALSAIFRLAVTWLALSFKSDSQTFFTVQLLFSFIETILIAIIVWKKVGFSGFFIRWNKAYLRTIRRFTAGTMLVSLTAAIVAYSDKVILSRVLSLSEYGVYTVLFILSYGLINLSYPLYNVMYPRFTALVQKESFSEIRSLLDKMLTILQVLFYPILVVLIVYSDVTLKIYMGEISQAHIVVFRILCIYTLFSGLIIFPHLLQMAGGFVSGIVKSNLLTLIFLLPALVVSGIYFKLTGVVLSLLLGIIINLNIMLYFSASKLKVGLIMKIYKSMVLFGVLLAIGLACRYLAFPNIFVGILQLIIFYIFIILITIFLDSGARRSFYTYSRSRLNF